FILYICESHNLKSNTMQGRMKQHQLSTSEIDTFLKVQKVGRLATLNPDGYPYITPVHFVYLDNYIYIHGLCKGQKIDNVKRNPAVCFEIDEMSGLILDEKPCDVNTSYQSIIILGKAYLTNEEEKIGALKELVHKYTPHFSDTPFPTNMLKVTTVIKITIQQITGKYYR
ncbi:MAG: pyridoxamine 5'-phosphate oxidase family protein, partial [Clostridium sp.]|nr:pyridoxamine 5'-phosphate oxidase family protein [Clostridium sp.]